MVTIADILGGLCLPRVSPEASVTFFGETFSKIRESNKVFCQVLEMLLIAFFAANLSERRETAFQPRMAFDNV